MINKKIILKDKKIVITRAQNQLNESRKIFDEYGAIALDLPSLIIVPPNDFAPLDQALDKLDDFDWVVFSSANGVNAVEERLRIHKYSLSKKYKNLKIAAVGRKTASLLKEKGVNVDFFPPEFVADSLINNFPVSVSGLKILIPRVQSGGRSILAESFELSGAKVVEIAAYESCCPKNIPETTFEALNNSEVDAITFTSGKTVLHTFQLIKDSFQNQWENKLNRAKFISIGPQTSLACKKYFNRVDQEANPHDLNGLVNACIKAMN